MTSSKNNKAIFGIFAMVFVFFVILIVFAFYTMNAFNETSNAEKNSNRAHIGVIEVEGVIMDSKDTVDLLQTAEEDKQIEAIILRVNSPGGAVGPTQEIYEEIFYPILSLKFGYTGTAIASLIVGLSSFIVWHLAYKYFQVNILI